MADVSKSQMSEPVKHVCLIMLIHMLQSLSHPMLKPVMSHQRCQSSEHTERCPNQVSHQWCQTMTFWCQTNDDIFRCQTSFYFPPVISKQRCQSSDAKPVVIPVMSNQWCHTKSSYNYLQQFIYSDRGRILALSHISQISIIKWQGRYMLRFLWMKGNPKCWEFGTKSFLDLSSGLGKCVDQ